MHLLNFSLIVVNDPVINEANYTLTDWLLTSEPGMFGLVGGVANPTGVALIIILVVICICSQSFVRRGGSFEVFYWTHLLYIPFWVLIIFHGPNFWKWFIVPGILYLFERFFRLATMRSERGKTYISSGILLPSRVTHLVIKRPHNFDFHPGDYVFVNVPAIAKYEWHPFTISSAPEQEDDMWLHIRGVGEWTNRLYNYFEHEQEKLYIVEEQLAVNRQLVINGTPEPKGIKRQQTSIQRKFTDCDSSTNGRSKAMDFIKEGNSSLTGCLNESSSSDGDFNLNSSMPHHSDTDISGPHTGNNDCTSLTGPPRKMTPEKKLHMLLMSRKSPLSKSLSMPDMQTRVKKRERLIALREYMRSESEKSFDECQIRRARLHSLGVAYLNPQNKSLAQSFRYMRNKPTIIAFKTPSLEHCEAAVALLSDGSSQNADRMAEEGRAPTVTKIGAQSDDIGLELVTVKSPITSMNYPVGKPLEPINEENLTEPTAEGIGMEIYLDGPYGAPSSHIFRAQHAVLIATGIGVTPFASILQSIMHRYRKARHRCPRCKFEWASDIPATVMNLRKVDFFWINRDQRSFEWFVNLLSQLEIEQAELGVAMERFLEMHMYITSALQKTDMKAVGLQLALDLLHEKEKRDLITGLKTRTNAGRPNWDKVFKQLLDQKKGKVTVFYCGPPQLGRILRIKCDQFGFSFRKEVF
jgi:hypothetical protein